VDILCGHHAVVASRIELYLGHLAETDGVRAGGHVFWAKIQMILNRCLQCSGQDWLRVEEVPRWVCWRRDHWRPNTGVPPPIRYM